MSRSILLCCIALLYCSYVYSQSSGVAVLTPTTLYGVPRNVSGTIAFFQNTTANLVTVVVNISGNLDAGRGYGLHVHTYGDLTDAATGNSAAGHYNLGNQSHSCPPNASRHVGDMGNWIATANGIFGIQTFDLQSLTGANSTLGRAVVLHNGTDDCNTQPTGNSGNRLALGVIGITGVSGNQATNTIDAPLLVTALTPTSLSTDYCLGGNNCSGVVYFIPSLSSANITVVARVTGLRSLTNSAHGIHVHTYGDLTSGNGASVGAHWNPNNSTHNVPPYTPRHLGDLGSVQSYDTDGTAYYSQTFPIEQIGSISSLIGRAVVIHASFDHGAGANCDQAGASGTRILWGAIGLTNNGSINIPPTVTLNTVYNITDCAPSASPNPSVSPSGSSTTTTSTSGGTTGSSGMRLVSWFSKLF